MALVLGACEVFQGQEPSPIQKRCVSFGDPIKMALGPGACKVLSAPCQGQAMRGDVAHRLTLPPLDQVMCMNYFCVVLSQRNALPVRSRHHTHWPLLNLPRRFLPRAAPQAYITSIGSSDVHELLLRCAISAKRSHSPFPAPWFLLRAAVLNILSSRRVVRHWFVSCLVWFDARLCWRTSLARCSIIRKMMVLLADVFRYPR